MAFALVQTKFFGCVDLKYGVWLYGILALGLSVYYILAPALTAQDWIVFIGICSPASALLFMQLIFQDKFAYAWANWYFSFFGFLLGTIYVIMNTIYLAQLMGEIGEGQIRFRLSEAGNPMGPHLINDQHLSAESADFVHHGLEALPKRYFDIQALYHGNDKEFSWANGDATLERNSSTLQLFIIFDWIFYVLFGYLVLTNYSHFVAAKSWTDYKNFTL